MYLRREKKSTYKHKFQFSSAFLAHEMLRPGQQHNTDSLWCSRMTVR